MARIDPSTGEVVAEIEVPGIASGVVVDENTGDVWVTRLGRLPFDPGQLLRIDSETNAISQRFEVEDGATQMMAASGGAAWVQGPDGRLSKINSREETIERTFDWYVLPPDGPKVEAGALWAISPAPSGASSLTHLDLESGRATIISLEESGIPGARTLAVGEGAVWVIGAGTLTRITP